MEIFTSSEAIQAWEPSFLSVFPVKVKQLNLVGLIRLRTLSWFYQVPQSKFVANRSRGSWVMIGHPNRQTNIQAEITTVYIYMINLTSRMEYWGPCKESPVIISPPSDTYGPKGKYFWTFYRQTHFYYILSITVPIVNMVKK